MAAKENCRFVVEDATIFAGKRSTEIYPEDRAIRKTWKLIGFTLSRTYEFDNNVAVQIKDKSTLFEGYNITSFGVYITCRGRKIWIFSTDDLDAARLIQSQITDVLKKSATKMHGRYAYHSLRSVNGAD